eukprot:scaffold30887_cov24-Prasinocladus_malaysianus.AAC.2
MENHIQIGALRQLEQRLHSRGRSLLGFASAISNHPIASCANVALTTNHHDAYKGRFLFWSFKLVRQLMAWDECSTKPTLAVDDLPLAY